MRHPPSTTPGTRARAGRRRRPLPGRRALTFLEIVFATAMLGLVVSVMFGAIGFMLGRQRLEQRTLGAAELANRLMLQYLDDPTALPNDVLPIAYGQDRYHWHRDVTSLRIVPAEPAGHPGRTETAERPTSLLEKSDLVTIKVWLSEESGGSAEPNLSVPHAAVSRIVYPFLMGRNPDSMNYWVQNDTIMGMIRDKLGSGGGGPSIGSYRGGGKSSQPRPSAQPQPSTPGGAR